jgi:energy-coupling factor transporter ATP-binding protein EcfA2
MSISIQKNEEPPLKKPSFVVDGKLHDKLDNYEITKLMNKHSFTLFLGRAGSGKSTLLISLLQSPKLFKNVYHTIILFCPPNSRASIKNDFWSVLPEEQIYDELNIETLTEAYQMAEANAAEGFRTLIVLDDVQKSLKGEAEKLLLHIVNNRRHAGLSIWMACQTYKSIPRQVRQGLSSLFIFKIQKGEMVTIFEEQVEIADSVYKEILDLSYKKPHDFIFIDTNSQNIFVNWDKVIIEDE